MDDTPEFGTDMQNLLITQLQLTRQLNENMVTYLLGKMQHDEYAREKSIIEKMIVSINKAIVWYPNNHQTVEPEV